MSNLTKKLIASIPLFGSFSLIPTNLLLRKVIKMLMILSHGQPTVERGFSGNGKLLVENFHMQSLIAQRHIHHHMQSYDLQAHDLGITHELLDSVSSARKRYFQNQKKKSLTKDKSSKDCQLAELNEEILKLNTEATLLKSAISDVQKVQTRSC